MIMSINSNNIFHSFRFTPTTIIILSVLFLFSYLLNGHISVEVFGIVPNSDVKSNTPIKHIIVISQGKRSFDNYFGTFPGANGFPANLTVPLNPYPQPLLKFTVAAWFNSNNSLSKSGFLINKGGTGVETPGKNMNYGIWMNSRGNLIGGFENKSGTDYHVTSNHTYNDGVWHNVVVTYNGNSELKLFIDGNLSGTTKTGGAIPDFAVTEPLRIGSNSYRPDNFFNGSIDEVRVWNRSLENSEILKGYHTNTFDSAGQLVYLPFKDNDKKSDASNAIKSGTLKPYGIYLNGSSYKDVISQGKRSFDNYFGTFPGANGFPANLTVPLNPYPQPLLKFTVAAWFNSNNSLSKSGFLI